MKRRKKKNYRKYYPFIIIAFLLLGTIIVYNYKLNYIEKVIKDLFINIQRPFIRINKMDCINNNLYKSEYEEIKKVVDIDKTLIDYNYIYVSVVYRNINSFYDTITINKGSVDGIKANDAVTFGDYVIGRVIDTTSNTSNVLLLTSNTLNNRLSVMIKNDSTYYGLLSGFIDNRYIVENIDNNIKKNDILYTTGYDEYYPKGLIIGRVDQIGKDNYGLSSVLYIKPIITIDDTDYLTVIAKK